MVDKVPGERVLPGLLRECEGGHVDVASHVAVGLRRVDVAAAAVLHRAPDGAGAAAVVRIQTDVPRRQRRRGKHVGQITISHCRYKQDKGGVIA